jgi:hypothetical protein
VTAGAKVSRVDGDPSDEILHEPAGDVDRPATIDEHGRDPDARVEVRRLPRLCVQGFHIIMASHPFLPNGSRTRWRSSTCCPAAGFDERFEVGLDMLVRGLAATREP